MIEEAMSYVSGVDREQTMLLPESLEEYVAAEHPVRFIEAFVAGLEVERCGFQRAQPAETGRPGYDPKDLLKLYIWGYLNRVRSSRRLERECLRNLELIWLLRKLAPDFKTIADFRKENASAFKAVFREFGVLCRDLGLWGAELVAIDGTKLKAVNSPARNHTGGELQAWLERLDARVEEYLRRMEKEDAPGGEGSARQPAESLREKLVQLEARRGEVRELLAELERSGAAEISRTDPDSRRMGKVGVGYNGQIAVDERHKLIIEAEVVTAQNDLHELATMAKAACEALGVDPDDPKAGKPKFIADRGYHAREVLAESEAAGIESYVPQPLRGRARADGHYHKSAFIYDPATDHYRCPQGVALQRESETIKHGVPATLYSNAAACGSCALKGKCTSSPYRRIERYENEAVVERVAARVAANPRLVRRRGALVEHPFGTLMFWWNQRAFLMRGLDKVRGEFRLSALAYNLKRVIHIVGVGPLLEKLKARRKSARDVLLSSNLPAPGARLRNPLIHFLLRCLTRTRTTFA